MSSRFISLTPLCYLYFLFIIIKDKTFEYYFLLKYIITNESVSHKTVSAAQGRYAIFAGGSGV